MTGSGDTGSVSGAVIDRFAVLSRCDLVLLVIPLAFLASLFAGNLLAVPSRWAVVAASAVGALAVADALFVHPPRAGGA